MKDLESIRRDHHLAGIEQTGGMRWQWYGEKGWSAIKVLLEHIDETTPRNRKERRAAMDRERIPVRAEAMSANATGPIASFI
jgi:hypothetical protein